MLDVSNSLDEVEEEDYVTWTALKVRANEAPISRNGPINISRWRAT